VFDEVHRVVAEGTPSAILRDRVLLRDVNLVHDHVHRHGPVVHAHEHGLEHHGREVRDAAAEGHGTFAEQRS
jgi:cobalt/nickel transport system ATP-binding protein